MIAAGLVLGGTLVAAARALAVGAVNPDELSPSPIAAAGSLAAGATKCIV